MMKRRRTNIEDDRVNGRREEEESDSGDSSEEMCSVEEIEDREREKDSVAGRRRLSPASSSAPSPGAESEEENQSVFMAGRGHKKPITAARIIQMLRLEKGMLTNTARRLGISYNGLRKYILSNKKMQDALLEIEEHALDKAQKKLYDMIEDGNSAAIYFYLRCKGKNRGFIEGNQHVIPPSHPVTFKYQLVLPNVTSLSGDQRKQIATSGDGQAKTLNQIDAEFSEVSRDGA